jgi:hypothetical protein
LAQRFERLGAALDRHDLDVVMPQELGDAEPLGGVVLDHEEPTAAPARIFLDARQRLLEPFLVGGLGDEGEGAARQAVLAVLVEGEDLHGDVARRRVLLELAQHRPAQHVRQEHVERDGARLILAREHERVAAARRDQHLEARIMGEVGHDARIVRIVLDDQQRGFTRLDAGAVVGDGLRRRFGESRARDGGDR